MATQFDERLPGDHPQDFPRAVEGRLHPLVHRLEMRPILRNRIPRASAVRTSRSLVLQRVTWQTFLQRLDSHKPLCGDEYTCDYCVEPSPADASSLERSVWPLQGERASAARTADRRQEFAGSTALTTGTGTGTGKKSAHWRPRVAGATTVCTSNVFVFSTSRVPVPGIRLAAIAKRADCRKRKNQVSHDSRLVNFRSGTRVLGRSSFLMPVDMRNHSDSRGLASRRLAPWIPASAELHETVIRSRSTDGNKGTSRGSWRTTRIARVCEGHAPK